MNRADTVTDFTQFAGLRAQAQRGDDAAVRKVAQQFEALFTQQLLKNMRSGELASDVMGGGQSDFYRDIFDQQMAVHLSSGKGIGLADMLVNQLRGRQSGAEAAAVDPSRNLPARPTASSAGVSADAASLQALGAGEGSDGADPVGQTRLMAALRVAMAKPAGSTTAETADAGDADQQAQRFIADIQPHAERAARQLGVPTQVVMAQAALETGWGRHAASSASGGGFNFFGIKADKSWQGNRNQAQTTEYRGGAAQTESASFRSYGSPAEAFDDYVRFLQSNPRYAQALNSGGNPAAFAYGLQNAGYATDPAYAQKLLALANSPTIRAAVAQSSGGSAI